LPAEKKRTATRPRANSAPLPSTPIKNAPVHPSRRSSVGTEATELPNDCEKHRQALNELRAAAASADTTKNSGDHLTKPAGVKNDPGQPKPTAKEETKSAAAVTQLTKPLVTRNDAAEEKSVEVSTGTEIADKVKKLLAKQSKTVDKLKSSLKWIQEHQGQTVPDDAFEGTLQKLRNRSRPVNAKNDEPSEVKALPPTPSETNSIPANSDIASAFAKGDRVKVTGQTHNGQIGEIIRFSNRKEKWVVKLPHAKWNYSTEELVRVTEDTPLETDVRKPSKSKRSKRKKIKVNSESWTVPSKPASKPTGKGTSKPKKTHKQKREEKLAKKAKDQDEKERLASEHAAKEKDRLAVIERKRKKKRDKKNAKRKAEQEAADRQAEEDKTKKAEAEKAQKEREARWAIENAEHGPIKPRALVGGNRGGRYEQHKDPKGNLHVSRY